MATLVVCPSSACLPAFDTDSKAGHCHSHAHGLSPVSGHLMRITCWGPLSCSRLATALCAAMSTMPPRLPGLQVVRAFYQEVPEVQCPSSPNNVSIAE